MAINTDNSYDKAKYSVAPPLRDRYVKRISRLRLPRALRDRVRPRPRPVSAGGGLRDEVVDGQMADMG